MNFWDKITGDDMRKEWKAFEARVKKLPDDYNAAWGEVTVQLSQYSDFSGRNLMPIFDNILEMLEVSAADGQSAQEVFGGDIPGLCAALAGTEGAKTYRDKWREQLNANVAKKLSKLEGSK